MLVLCTLFIQPETGEESEHIVSRGNSRLGLNPPSISQNSGAWTCRFQRSLGNVVQQHTQEEKTMGLLNCGRMCQCDHLCVNWGCHVASLKAGTKVGDF